MDIDLSAYHHPKDPRVVVTSCREVFIAAAKHSDYIAAILQRDEAEKQHLRALYQGLWEQTALCPEADQALFKLKFTPGNKDKFLKQDSPIHYLREEFLLMAELLTETGMAPDGVMFISRKNWREETGVPGKHSSHDHPVLNAVWLSGGTIWKLPDEVNWAQVDEGDILFMKSDVEHSPEVLTNERIGKPRYSIICIPEGMS